MEGDGQRTDGAAKAAETDPGGEAGFAGAERIEADDAVGRDVVVGDETADDDELVIGGLERDRGGGDVEAGAGRERGIEGTEFGEASDAGGGIAVEGGEVADGDDLLVGLEDEGVDGVVEAGIEGECGVGRAVGIEADDAIRDVAVDAGEGSRDEDFLVGGLDCEGVDIAAGDAGADFGGEGGVERAVGVEPCEAELVDSADVAEGASDHNLVVGLDGEVVDRAGDERGRERGIERAVLKKAGDAGDRGAVNGGEGTCSVETTVGKRRNLGDTPHEFDAGLERRARTQGVGGGGRRHRERCGGRSADGQAVDDEHIIVAGGVEAEGGKVKRGRGRADDWYAEFAPLVAEGAGAAGGDGE